MLNKKGDADDWFPPILAILFIIWISWFFFSFTTAKEKDLFYRTDELERDIDADSKLTEFLRSTITTDLDKDGEIEDISTTNLIVYSYLNNDYSVLEEESIKYLESIRRHEVSGWNIQIFLMPEDEELTGFYTLRIVAGAAKTNSESLSYIPLPNTEDYIKIRLYERCQGDIC